MHKNLTMALAEYAASTSVNRIPAHVRELAKQVILDEMASAHFGRRSLAGDLTARYVAEQGGRPDCQILGTDLRAPAQYAAMANGAAGHGEEVDGAHVIGGHPGATVVHACVAMAERQQASGAELINAVVLAYDVGVRLVAACGGKFAVRARLHLYSDFLYALGASAAASRLLLQAPLQHCYALALCSFQTNALGALFQEKRHISKSFCNGQFAFAGVSASLMSAAGLEGVDDVIGRRAGLLDAWGAQDGAAAVTQGLGEEWRIQGANFKFINAGYPIHTAVEAATTLANDHGITTASIASVHIGMPADSLKTVDSREMHNICVQDMVCAALVRPLHLRNLPFPDMLTDPAFTRLRPHVTAGLDAELERTAPSGRGSNVTIVTSSGASLSRCIEDPKGHSRRGGVTWSDLRSKWQEGLPGCDVDSMVGLAQRLDDLADVRELSAAFRVG